MNNDAQQHAFAIRLRPVPGLTCHRRFKQVHANNTTQIDLRDLLPQDHPSTIVDVRLDGTVHKHRVIEPGIVAVSPLVPLEGGYLVVRYLCPPLALALAQEGTCKALQSPSGKKPPPEPTYGFTAPQATLLCSQAAPLRVTV